MQKSADLEKALNSEMDMIVFSRWLAEYLVFKRVCVEPNFHILYAEFLQVKLWLTDFITWTLFTLTTSFWPKMLLTFEIIFTDLDLFENLWLGLQDFLCKEIKLCYESNLG